MSARRSVLVSSLLFFAACVSGDPVSPPTGELKNTARAADLWVECDEEYLPEQCAPGPDNPLDESGDQLYLVPGDPNPGANGLWLGANVHPVACFANLALVPIMDSDQDWLADHCELEIARGFAPTMRMSLLEGCPEGEPYFGAMYHLNGEVRIAYMPAYYKDCGPYGTPGGIGAGHHGDTEYIMVVVKFNSTTRHWYFVEMYLSSHDDTMGDRSKWVSAAETRFSRRDAAHPSVWVAIAKHANYRSSDVCNQTLWGDVCGSTMPPFRIAVIPERNVGSEWIPMPCRASEGRYAGNGRQECFFGTSRAFAGWHPDAAGVKPYREYLTSIYFNQRCTAWLPFGGEARGACIESIAPPRGAPETLPLGGAVAISGPSYGYEEWIGLEANGSLQYGAVTAGIHYTWEERTCRDGDFETNCNLDWHPIGAGVDLRTVSIYLSRFDIHHKVRVTIRQAAGGAIAAQHVHQVNGAGESSSACYPFDCTR